MDRDSTTYLLWNMLIWGGADRVIYTVTITMLRTLSTLAVLIWWPGSDGAWLVVILLAITHVGHVETVKRTAARVVGTVIGAAAAAVSVTIITTGAVLVGVGLILVVAAVVIRMGSHYWLYMLGRVPTILVGGFA